MRSWASWDSPGQGQRRTIAVFCRLQPYSMGRLPPIIRDLVQHLQDANSAVSASGGDTWSDRQVQRSAQLSVKAAMHRHGLSQWPERGVPAAGLFESVMKLLAQRGLRRHLDAAYVAHSSAVAAWKAHLSATGVEMPKAWGGTVWPAASGASSQGCLKHHSLGDDDQPFYHPHRWWDRITLQPCTVVAAKLRPPIESPALPVPASPVPLQELQEVQEVQELQEPSTTLSPPPAPTPAPATATAMQTLQLTSPAVTLVQPCMTSEGETWEVAHAQRQEGRSLRRHIPPNTSRYPGSSALACHAASAARAHAPPAYAFPKGWTTCPKGPRVILSRDALQQLGGGGVWWTTAPTNHLHTGQAVRVLTAAGRVHVLAKRVATPDFSGVTRESALLAQAGMRAELLALKVCVQPAACCLLPAACCLLPAAWR